MDYRLTDEELDKINVLSLTQDDKDELGCTPAVKQDTGNESQPVPVLIGNKVIRQKENR